MRKTIDLILSLSEKDIYISVENGKLKVNAPDGALADGVIQEIKTHREELITYLLATGKKITSEIPHTAIKGSYALSSSQRRLWVLSQFEEVNIAYNMSGVYVFEGDLNKEALEYSFNRLIGRHEILRTVFKEDEQGEVRQFIMAAQDAAFRIGCEDLRQENEQEARLKNEIRKCMFAPFDLATGPLVRADLFQMANDRWVFTYTMHHIIGDAWSMNILIKELLLIYNAYTEGASEPLQPLRIQYKDYAAWQQEQLSGDALKNHKAYWLKQFEGEVPALLLPGDRIRPAVKTYSGEVTSRKIPAKLGNGIQSLSQEQGGTLFMGLLTAVNILLYRYTQQDDIVIGTSIASREHTDLEDQIGFYVNTLALRTRFTGEDRFLDVFNQVKQVTLGAYEHQVYPFDELVNELNLQRDRSRSSLFDVMVVLQNTGNDQEKQTQNLGNIKVHGYNTSDAAISKFDLTFFFAELSDGLQVNIVYNKDIYNKATIVRLGAHLEQLLDAIISNPTKSIRELNYVSAEEKEQLRVRFAESIVTYPRDKTVVDLFEEQAMRTPDNIALVFEAQTFTYRQLKEQTDQLAAYLRINYDIRADDILGIMLNRSAHMIIALLGILKSGGAYVAIEPETPKARKAFILKDTGIKALITQSDYVFDLDYFAGNVFAIDIQLDEIATDSSLPRADIRPADLAYVIYTSGSTGQPKGVMIAHQSLVDYFFGIVDRTNIRSCKSFGLVSTIAADLGNTVLYPSLLTGGALHVFSANDVTNGERMSAAKLDCIKIVPSHWKALQDGSKLFMPAKCLIFGGEQLTGDTIELIRLHKSNCQVYNHYGPSETTIGKLINHIDIHNTDVKLSLGRPFCNSSVYILDEHNNLQPVGITGEICIAGDGLARGYLNNEALSSERFVVNPFKPGERMYRTGDAGRWLEDGTIEFLGRKDDQVKIRGYRIEPGEIAHILQSHPAIESAVVLARTRNGIEQELIAYIAGKEVLSKGEIQTYLSASLPSYMIPGFYVFLPALPLTPNGKIDRKRLPDPEDFGTGSRQSYLVPRTETEKKLVSIWQEVLGKDRIGVMDDFFELGGHSLKATRLASQIYRTFEVSIEFHELFSKTVLEDQAVLIEQAQKTSFVSIPATAPQPNYPLSSSQHRLWVLSQFEGGNTAYNVPGEYVFEGALNFTALTAAFDSLIARHEILRTVFKEDEQGEIKQFIKTPEEIGFTIGYHDFREEKQQEEKVKALIQAAIYTPFNLAAGPLVQASLYQVANNKWIFSYNMHHIISDAWSKDILMKELLLLYNAWCTGAANPLTPLRIQYKDYAVWQQEQIKGENSTVHKDYWLKQFEGDLPVLELPVDKVRPAIKTFNGGVVVQRIDAELSKGLNTLMQAQGCTLFMGLLATVNALLYRYTSQQDIIIGTPISGREHIDLEDQIGFYVNTLVVRTRFKGENSFKELLETVRQGTLSNYAHQLYPFDELVNELKLRRDMSRSALFDVMVSLQNSVNNEAANQHLTQIKASGYEGSARKNAKLDLSFDFAEIGNELQVRIEYNSDIFNRTSIERLLKHLEQLLGAITEQPSIPIQQLDYLSEKEKEQLLSAFNDTAVVYPEDQTIVELFEQQVSNTPDNIALICDGNELSYEVLNERSNQLAHYLRHTYNIQPDDLIGIKLERSEWMIISILGVLKSGGAYVPIDLNYPQERIEYMKEDSNCKLVLDEQELEKFEGEAHKYDSSNPASINKPTDLAYVIYTSGTTGRPKGVMIEHRSLLDYAITFSTHFSLQAADSIIQQSSFSFDTHVEEIYPALLTGACILISKNGGRDINELNELIHEKNATILSTTPLVLRELNSLAVHLNRIRLLISGGDKFNSTYLSNYIGKVAVYDSYGPSESTVCSTYCKIESIHSAAIIGKPIANRSIYILSHELALQPVGVIGEICIGGNGLARGYLNNSLLTTEKFIDNPVKAGERIYRTGDLGRWLPDGTIEFMGRKDEQVKIRGYRIEPGEIENALQMHPAIDDAVVTGRSNQEGEQELVAYIVSKEPLYASDIRVFLTKSVPAYMIPTHFVQLASLPLMPNGKVDKKQLPVPDTSDLTSGEVYAAPETNTEKKLVEIWQEVLKQQQIGVQTSFFNLGGNSIKIVKMSQQVNKAFGTNFTIDKFFEYLTIRDIARVVEQGEAIQREKIVKKETELINF